MSTCDHPLQLVSSCSGASSAAQMANHLAVRLDRLRAADMSCIAGVGGDVKPLVRMAKSGRAIMAIDGCPLHCAGRILQRHGITPGAHFDLSREGVEKAMHKDFDQTDAQRLLPALLCACHAIRNQSASAPVAPPDLEPVPAALP